MNGLADRGHFLNLAALFEGLIIVLAFLLGWIAGIAPLGTITWAWEAVAWGLGAAVPLLFFFLLTHWLPLGPLQRIRRVLVDMLGPSLVVCHWYDLLFLSLLVGFAEELLFRGVLQPWLSAWGYVTGLVASNVLFGLAHSVTVAYAVLAALIGLYLGWLLDVTGERNLLVPALTHAAYDFVAFLIVAHTYRKKSAESRQA